MSQSPVWWRVLVLSTIVLCIAFAVAASGDDKKQLGSFSTVDLQKIQVEFKAKQAIEGDLVLKQGKLERALQRRELMPLLANDDHKLLDSLLDKDITTRTDAEKKKITELQDRGNGLTKESTALRQKDQKLLTDADKKRLQDTDQALVTATQVFSAFKDDETKKLREFVSTNTEALLMQIRKAVAKVAEKQGISIVFNSEVALYAGTDITKPVIGELNK